MIRCPTCDSTDSTLVGRLSVEPSRIADQRECDACGERWTMPAQSIAEDGGVERIELGTDDAVGFDAGDIEYGFDAGNDSAFAGSLDES